MTYAAQPPPAAPQPPSMPRNGFGITALCLAIPGILFGLMPITGFVAFILGALALIFGLLGVARVRKGVADNTKMSWFGTALGAIATTLGIVMMVMFFQALAQLDRDLQRISGQGTPSAVTGPGQERVHEAPPSAVQNNEDSPFAPVDPPEAGPEPYSGLGEAPGNDLPPPVAPPPTAPETAPPPNESFSVPAAEQVTVKVTGDVGEATIDYYVGMDMGSTTEALPYTYSGTSDGLSPASVMVSTPIPMDISTRIPSGTITCQILVNGEIVDENSASGEGPMVTCTEP